MATNYWAQPQAGMGAYGGVPGALSPPDPFADLFNVIPELPAINRGVAGTLKNAAAGQLSPEVLAQIQDSAARFGVSSGMPGTSGVGGTLASNRGLRDVGRTAMDEQKWAAGAYPGFVGAVSNTQTLNPALQADIANTNAINRAAPNPGAAASEAQRLFEQYLQKTANSSRGPQGGTGGGGGLPGVRPSPSGGTGGYSAPAYGGGGGGGGASYNPWATDFGGMDSGPTGAPFGPAYPNDFGGGIDYGMGSGSTDFGGGLDYGGGDPWGSGLGGIDWGGGGTDYTDPGYGAGAGWDFGQEDPWYTDPFGGG